MKKINLKKIKRNIIVIVTIMIVLTISIFISLNLIINPLIYWLASTEAARVFLSCIISWLGVSFLFDIFYKIYKSRAKSKKSNAMYIPYQRKFRGRK